MIIDSHVHYGTSVWGDATPKELLDIINEVDFAICSNLEGIESVNFKDELSCNLEMIKASKGLLCVDDNDEIIDFKSCRCGITVFCVNSRGNIIVYSL